VALISFVVVLPGGQTLDSQKFADKSGPFREKSSSGAAMNGAALPAGERARLAKILGMCGSDYAGERAAAGARADALIRQYGLTEKVKRFDRLLRQADNSRGRKLAH